MHKRECAWTQRNAYKQLHVHAWQCDAWSSHGTVIGPEGGGEHSVVPPSPSPLFFLITYMSV